MSRGTLALIASLAAALLTRAAPADSPRDLIARGHQEFQAGRYEHALKTFEQIPEEGNDAMLPELLHDKAAAQYKLGRFDEARELWVRASGLRDAAFEAQSRYNIGNCHYERALQQVAGEQPQPEAAKKLLDEAIAQYRDALRLDPQLANARANLELAASLKKKIEEQKPPDSQPQSQPSSQPNESQDPNQPSQQQQQPQSQPGDPNQPQDGDQDQQQPESRPSSQPQSQPKPQPQDPNDPNQPQEQPDPDMQRQEQPEHSADELEPPPDVKMSPEEARRLLQMIRDAEKQRREALRARQRARPVEKDW